MEYWNGLVEWNTGMTFDRMPRFVDRVRMRYTKHVCMREETDFLICGVLRVQLFFLWWG